MTYVVFRTELGLHPAEAAQLPGELEGGEERVAGGESDEGGGGEGAVCVDAGL